MDYKIVVVGGWCGNLLFIVANHVEEILSNAGFSFEITTKNVWENYTEPPKCDLILQLMPAYSSKDTGSPVINIRRLLVERDHLETIEKIMHQMKIDFGM